MLLTFGSNRVNSTREILEADTKLTWFEASRAGAQANRVYYRVDPSY